MAKFDDDNFVLRFSDLFFRRGRLPNSDLSMGTIDGTSELLVRLYIADEQNSCLWF
jgi:hypothetical protein